MTKYLADYDHIRGPLERMIHNDPVFRSQDIDIGDFCWPVYSLGFEGLCRIVTGQQISSKAADSLWSKLTNKIKPLTAENFLKYNEPDLKELGLSRQKQSYLKNLADLICQGKFDPSDLTAMDDDQIRKTITSLKGFGPWSAEIYLLFCLKRPDVWPAGDLGVQIGLQKYLGSVERPDFETTLKEGERFSPNRTAGALLMWYMKDKC